MNKREREHLNRLSEMGCCVCTRMGFEPYKAEIHHLRTGQGMSQRSSHFDAIPLCEKHHRTGGYGVAIHAGQKEWESRYGTELELLEYTREMMK